MKVRKSHQRLDFGEVRINQKITVDQVAEIQWNSFQESAFNFRLRSVAELPICLMSRTSL